MYYRTRTYIAADWENDEDAIEILRKWNESDYWSLSFSDAHDLMQARDSSLNCSIKDSLRKRLSASKTFVLIVGEKTKLLRSGSCSFCDSYNSHTWACARGKYVDYDSFIDFECKQAVHDRISIVVLHKGTIVNTEKCPESVKSIGIHVPMYCRENGEWRWNYKEIKAALDEAEEAII